MVTIEQRPMLPEEREIVARWVKSPSRERAVDWGCVGLPLVSALIGALMGVLLAGVLLNIIGGAHTRLWLRPALLLGLLVGAGAGIAYVAVYGHRSRLFRRGYAAELSFGQVQVWHCTATAAVAIASAEGAAPWGYLLQGDDRQVLFLDVFHLAELTGDISFPCQHFDVILLPNAELVVRVMCLEGELEPRQTHISDAVEDKLPQHPVLLAGDVDHINELLHELHGG